ncbi:MAG: DUF302 domain-containing protein [Burkholderiales bacterium]|nr:DUF302 domain-containing protein [Burkholderiales bacterium]
MLAAHRTIAGIALAIILHGSLTPATAQTSMQMVSTRPDWVVKTTPHPYPALVQKLEDAVKANKMGVVNAASASEGAKAQGFAIPGNRVVGVFRNDFARRMLAASLPAGIEAPVRFYVTENADGTGSLSYRLPSAVFAPYFAAEGGDLRAVAGELDIIFAKIAADAVAP